MSTDKCKICGNDSFLFDGICQGCRNKEYHIKKTNHIAITGSIVTSSDYYIGPIMSAPPILTNKPDENNNISNEALAERIADLERYVAEIFIRIGK